jgi:hypothetical protein
MRSKQTPEFKICFLASFAFTVALVASLGISTPALAADPAILDYCANTKTGIITSITEGACPTGELSLGAGPIARGDERPRAMVPQFKNRYNAAKAAAKKKGFSLQITSGWRSYKYQKQLFARAVKRNGSEKEASKWVLPPEKSNHPWGIAVDINYKVGGKKGLKAAAWLEKNGYKYGLCRRYKNEWWHFEPLVAPGTKCPAMEPYAS